MKEVVNISKLELKDPIEQLCSEKGVDFFGVAPVSRFENAPKSHRPQDFLSKAESVVSIGLKIPDGVREANRKAFEEGNMRHGIYIYQMHGYVQLNRVLNDAAYSIAKFLEGKGFKSIPVPASPPSDPKKLTGVFSNRHAAVAAGNAEFGWNTLAVTEEAGPRARWGSIFTTAFLSPGNLLDEGICLDNCLKCVKACPVNAIPEKESVRLEIEDRTYEYSNLDKWKCRIGGVSGLSTELSRNHFKLPENVESKDFLDALNFESRWQKMERIASMCGRCIIECPVGVTE